tara:strand:+ start:1408 stop:1893 length:486 start_codon:yes stop_codon:yes gene_type:complete
LFLTKEDFSELVRLGPLVAIDLCILSSKGILLGKRNNAPAKSFYFVPGGRIRKNETILCALNRILKEETNISNKISSLDKKFLGVYEHFYEDNFFGNKEFNTHYVVFSYLIKLQNKGIEDKIILDDQHSEFLWYDRNSKINNKEIHQNSKAYFDHELINLN